MAQPGMLNVILKEDEAGILQRWIDRQLSAPGFRSDRLSGAQLAEQSRRFLTVLRSATQSGASDVHSPAWANVRSILDDLSATRVQLGFTPSETASFVFSLKDVLFDALLQRPGKDAAEVTEALRTTSKLLDELGLYTTEIHQKGREQVIVRQQQEMLELSTPVVTLWGGVLALPMIGTLDSARTQVVMETLLQRIVETGASIAIIDITGVPTVDTLTAQHLLKTVAAARLMGAECIISGIRPQIAQTIVHLGVDLGGVVTKATLADAFAICLRRLGLSIVKTQPAAARRRGTDDEAAGGSTDRQEI